MGLATKAAHEGLSLIGVLDSVDDGLEALLLVVADAWFGLAEEDLGVWSHGALDRQSSAISELKRHNTPAWAF